MTNEKMLPALSVKQPWAELILTGRKTIELRTFLPRYTGDVWLHTGKTPDSDTLQAQKLRNPFLGGYVGLVRIVSAVPLDESRWERWRDKHLDTGEFKRGYFAWLLEQPRRLMQPVPAPGNVKLFYPSAELSQFLRASLSESR